MKRSTTLVALALSTLALTSCAQRGTQGGGAYPDGDIRVIVPFEAGGNADSTARAIAPCLGEELGANMLVENVPGAGGVLGTRELADSEPDGYTVSINSISPAALAPSTVPDAGYTLDDLDIVRVVYSTPVITYVSEDSPYSDLDSLLKAAKKSPGDITIAVPGANTMQDIMVRQFSKVYDVPVKAVPVDSNSEIMRGVTAGDYDAGLAAVSLDYLPRIEDGEVKVLARGAGDEPAYLKDVPTYADLGYGDLLPSQVIDVPLVAPKGLPQKVTTALAKAVDACLLHDDIRDAIGSDFVPVEPEETAAVEQRYADLGAAAADAVKGAGS